MNAEPNLMRFADLMIGEEFICPQFALHYRKTGVITAVGPAGERRFTFPDQHEVMLCPVEEWQEVQGHSLVGIILGSVILMALLLGLTFGQARPVLRTPRIARANTCTPFARPV